MNNEEINKFEFFNKDEINLLSKQFESGFNVYNTTSVGRVLDAAAVLIRVCNSNTYDARCAMILEQNATGKPLNFKPVIKKEKDLFVLQTTPLFKFIYENLEKKKEVLALTILKYISEGFMKIVEKVNKDKLPVLFSGGVAYNNIICEDFLNKGYITNKILPCGDGNVSFGQVILNENKTKKL